MADQINFVRRQPNVLISCIRATRLILQASHLWNWIQISSCFGRSKLRLKIVVPNPQFGIQGEIAGLKVSVREYFDNGGLRWEKEQSWNKTNKQTQSVTLIAG
jgi:hypothetical protein